MLTYGSQDKMAVILETTFSNPFLPEANFVLQVLSSASVCVRLCVCQSVCQSLVCLPDNSGPV